MSGAPGAAVRSGMAELLTMNKQERGYLEVLQRVSRGELTRRTASELLSLSERQIYRLMRRYRTEGDGGVVHRLRGKPSNRGYDATTRHRIVSLYRDRSFRDYGPQLFSEIVFERLKPPEHPWRNKSRDRSKFSRPTAS